MIKRKMKLSLNSKFILVTVVGLLVSTVLFFLNLYIATTLIENVYLSDSAVQKRNLDNIEEFSFYVSANHVASSDMASILSWQEKKNDVYILVYQNDQIIFDSTTWENSSRKDVIDRFRLTDQETGEFIDSEAEKRDAIRDIKTKREREEQGTNSLTTEEITEMATEQEMSSILYNMRTVTVDTESDSEYIFYPVRFEDGIYDVCILDYSESSVYMASLILSFCISCICCILIIALYNRRVMKRVSRLNREVEMIRSKDINGDITVDGTDEIYVLADSIHNMRNTIIEQLSSEKAAWQANRDLVTSMAHDIRTPLTVLSGYLELLRAEEYSSKEEMKQYIEISMDKAMQLKDLSDKLFRYFFVYSRTDEEMKLEEYDAANLLQQLLGEYIILLEEKGFTFTIQELKQGSMIRVDVQYLKRMLDNIFTNVRKYADRTQPVVIDMDCRKSKLHLKIKNAISPDRNTAESTRIGMKTCQKIADQMGIRFWVVEKGMYYIVHLEFGVL